MTRLAVYPGSFDPITRGHEDLIHRGLVFADRVVVAVATQIAKQPLFTTEERVDLVRQTVGGESGIEVRPFDGLLVALAREIGASVIVRGLRYVSDFEYEYQMALMNRKLAPEIETVFLVPAYLCLAHQALCQERWWRWAPVWLGLLSYLLVGQGFPLGIINWLPQLGPWSNNLHVYLYYSIPTWGYLVLLLALGLAQGQRQTATHPETGRLARA